MSCELHPQLCHPRRGALYVFIMTAAIVTTLTSGLMAVRSLLHRSSVPADHDWIFRGIFFTLVLLIPLLFVGWTSVPEQQLLSLDTMAHLKARADGGASDPRIPFPSNGTGSLLPDIVFDHQPDSGIAGAFVIEATIVGLDTQIVKAAIVMFHINV